MGGKKQQMERQIKDLTHSVQRLDEANENIRNLQSGHEEEKQTWRTRVQKAEDDNVRLREEMDTTRRNLQTHIAESQRSAVECEAQMRHLTDELQIKNKTTREQQQRIEELRRTTTTVNEAERQPLERALQQAQLAEAKSADLLREAREEVHTIQETLTATQTEREQLRRQNEDALRQINDGERRFTELQVNAEGVKTEDEKRIRELEQHLATATAIEDQRAEWAVKKTADGKTDQRPHAFGATARRGEDAGEREHQKSTIRTRRGNTKVENPCAEGGGRQCPFA
jgi:chromosome segregation ATPase